MRKKRVGRVLDREAGEADECGFVLSPRQALSTGSDGITAVGQELRKRIRRRGECHEG